MPVYSKVEKEECTEEEITKEHEKMMNLDENILGFTHGEAVIHALRVAWNLNNWDNLVPAVHLASNNRFMHTDDAYDMQGDIDFLTPDFEAHFGNFTNRYELANTVQALADELEQATKHYAGLVSAVEKKIDRSQFTDLINHFTYMDIVLGVLRWTKIEESQFTDLDSVLNNPFTSKDIVLGVSPPTDTCIIQKLVVSETHSPRLMCKEAIRMCYKLGAVYRFQRSVMCYYKYGHVPNVTDEEIGQPLADTKCFENILAEFQEPGRKRLEDEKKAEIAKAKEKFAEVLKREKQETASLGATWKMQRQEMGSRLEQA
jgi:hypothetical protein